jgi:hypothetical protein
MSNFLILLASGLALIQGQDTGSFKCGCTGGVCKSGQSCSDGGKCVDLPSQMWLADGAPFCVRGGGGRCCGDNFGASCTSAQTCVRGTCVDNVASVCVTTPPPPLPRDGKCFTCSTPGVTSFSDGCNTCSCSATGAVSCTEKFCITLAPEEGSCERRCDGSVVVDGCKQYLCINGQKTNPVVLANAQCTPTNDPCASNDCGKDEKCVAEPKQCITTPCPQYRCEKPVVVAPLPRDGKCFTCSTPGVTSFSDGCNTCSCSTSGIAGCTKRACIALAPEEGSCERRCDGSVVVDGCKQYLCINGQKTNPVVLANAQCTPTNDPCASNDCGKDEKCVAEPKQCITTPCPQYRCEKPVVVAPLPRDGKCFTCSTPGVKSFSDGCNTCGCTETGAPAVCTELACIALAPAEGSCQRRCDGAIVKSDCLECVCKNGQKTDCLTVKDCNDDTNGASSLAWASLTLAIAFVAIF